MKLATSSLFQISGIALGTAILVSATSTPAKAISFVSQRADLQANDKIDWADLDFGISVPIAPGTVAKFVPYSFTGQSEQGLGYSVDIPKINNPRFTPPFIFPVTPSVPVNYSLGDAALFTGFAPGGFPAVGNPGPITIKFDTPVLGVGTQIGVDDSFQYTAFISAFDQQDNLLDNFSVAGIPPLNGIDNSAAFLGVSNNIANISKIVISSTEPNRALSLNFLSIKRASTPEPGIVFALGLLGIGLLTTKKKTTSNN
ncbi:MAG TPA: PEP-CTERM sorting domain-containing protein [Nostocaceae cyanobacterium]|nr:PEP-CTERM sorting domain-containing protein [Nostocaceae cyanobacterium]